MLVLVVWYWLFLSFLSPIRNPVPPVVVAVPRSYTYSAEQRCCCSVFLAVRCRLTPIAHGGLSDWGCCTVTDVLFRKVLQFLEPFRPYRRVPIPDDAPLVQGRLTRWSVIVDRVPSSFNLYVRGALSFDPVRPCEMFRRIVGYHTMPVDCTELSQIVQLFRQIFGLIRSEFILPSLLDCRPTFSVLFFFFSS